MTYQFRPRAIAWAYKSFGQRCVAGLRDKLREVAVGNATPVHPKAVDCHFVCWGFFGVLLVRYHEEAAAFNQDHSFRLDANLRLSLHRHTLVILCTASKSESTL